MVHAAEAACVFWALLLGIYTSTSTLRLGALTAATSKSNTTYSATHE